MSEMMSPAIGQLAAALAKAQGAMSHASKDKINPHFRSSYADLANVLDACRDALAANGLSVTQIPSLSGNAVTVTTLLLHASGEWVSSSLSMPLSKGDAQGVGSAITYARRYALAAIVGVAQDDDDGNGATGRGHGRVEQPPPPQKSATPQVPGHVLDLAETIDECKDAAALAEWRDQIERVASGNGKLIFALDCLVEQRSHDIADKAWAPEARARSAVAWLRGEMCRRK